MALLRAAGCVFAEEEAAVLREAARLGVEQAGLPGPEKDAGPDSLHDAGLPALLRRRLKGEPLEHVVGWVDFGELRLAVGPGIFIPRQRTLYLARLARKAVLNRVKSGTVTGVFVEAYAGVGPVAASVRQGLQDLHAEHPRKKTHWDVIVTDRDPLALEYAAGNLRDANSVYRGSGLSGLPLQVRGRVDVMAAVVPYVPETQAGLLPWEARNHQSDGTLFGGPDGLSHVRQILAELDQWLAPDGELLLEMHRTQTRIAATEAAFRGFQTRIRHARDGQTAVLMAGREHRAGRDQSGV